MCCIVSLFLQTQKKEKKKNCGISDVGSLRPLDSLCKSEEERERRNWEMEMEGLDFGFRALKFLCGPLFIIFLTLK